mmetsp:Transcript_1442/g.2011  ORF Transcript_1442/g.2011 Transcript_1442/m.2011 type:complete len:719 (+) Transcript_1442:8067-10223(+)
MMLIPSPLTPTPTTEHLNGCLANFTGAIPIHTRHTTKENTTALEDAQKRAERNKETHEEDWKFISELAQPVVEVVIDSPEFDQQKPIQAKQQQHIVNTTGTTRTDNIAIDTLALRSACRKINEKVPGHSATSLVDSDRAFVWVAVDLLKVFGMSPYEVERLGLTRNANTSSTNVVFRFSFPANNKQISRANATFEAVCKYDKLPRTTRQKRACVDMVPTGKTPVDWLLNDRVKFTFCANSVKTETAEEVLTNLSEFVGRYLSKASSRCIMCDKEHGISMPRPCVCDDESCVFQSRELGLGFSIEEEILNRPKVVELLLTFFSCSLLSRRKIDLEAIPKRIIEDSPYTDGFTPFTDVSSDELTRNELTLFYALNYVPSIEEMQGKVRKGCFKHDLDGIDKRLYPLLQWLIGGCRSFIRHLEPSRQFKDMQTPHQFVIDHAMVEKEAKFQEHQKKHGSFFSFHGSSSFAWNSIIAAGLKNLSNTENMSYGAMKGNGIYLSSSFHTSIHYAKPTKLKQPWANSSLGRHPRALALCEVIDDPESFAYTDQKCFTECTPQERAHGQLHVVPREDYIHTRYLFVYNEEIVPPSQSHHIFALRSTELKKLKINKAPATASEHSPSDRPYTTVTSERSRRKTSPPVIETCKEMVSFLGKKRALDDTEPEFPLAKLAKTASTDSDIVSCLRIATLSAQAAKSRAQKLEKRIDLLQMQINALEAQMYL